MLWHDSPNNYLGTPVQAISRVLEFGWSFDHVSHWWTLQKVASAADKLKRKTYRTLAHHKDNLLADERPQDALVKQEQTEPGNTGAIVNIATSDDSDDELHFVELIGKLEMIEHLPTMANGPVSPGPCSVVVGSFESTAMIRWHQIISDYSLLRLTLDRDCLPAIAGLWEDSLVLVMAWKLLKTSSQFPRPAKYVAPTWSWASVKGGVSHFRMETPSETYVEVLGAVCTPLGTMFSTGQVKNGYIVLRGHLKVAYLNFYGVADEPGHGSRGWFDNDYDFTASGPSYIDPNAVAYRLPLLSTHSSSPLGEGLLVLSLVLRCLNLKAQIYERIGILSQDNGIDMDPWLRDRIGFPTPSEEVLSRRLRTIVIV